MRSREKELKERKDWLYALATGFRVAKLIQVTVDENVVCNLLPEEIKAIEDALIEKANRIIIEEIS